MRDHVASPNEFRLPPGSFWWTGGASLILLPLLAFFQKGDVANSTLSSLGPYLLACFSFAHFAMTAFWFYRHKSLRQKHWFTAYASPFVMLTIGAALWHASETIVHLAFRAGLLTLYWHFAKQAFGVSVWMSEPDAKRSPLLKQMTLLTCLSIAAFGVLSAQGGTGQSSLFKYYVPQLEVAAWAPLIFQGLSGLFLLVAIGIAAALSDSRWGVIQTLTPIAALYFWMEPRFAFLGLATAPLFHGLQALPFTFIREKSRPFAALAIYLSACAAGWILLQTIPRFIGESTVENSARLTAIWIFVVNMHHFWLETFSWRGESLSAIQKEINKGAHTSEHAKNGPGLRSSEDKEHTFSA